MVIGSLVLSSRPPTLASFNNVAAAGPLPPGFVSAYGDDWSLAIHRSDWKPDIAAMLGLPGKARTPHLGWVVREWSFLGLPLFAYRQSDLAVVREDEYGFRLAGLTDDEAHAIARAGSVRWFPFWRYSWGLLAAAFVAVWIWLELRWQARRRAILGLI